MLSENVSAAQRNCPNSAEGSEEALLLLIVNRSGAISSCLERHNEQQQTQKIVEE